MVVVGCYAAETRLRYRSRTDASSAHAFVVVVAAAAVVVVWRLGSLFGAVQRGVSGQVT